LLLVFAHAGALGAPCGVGDGMVACRIVICGCRYGCYTFTWYCTPATLEKPNPNYRVRRLDRVRSIVIEIFT
jgi:hypothetical protein